MNYQQSWSYLDSLQFHKIKLGLDSMRSFLAKVGRPEKGLKYVHLAGTNGKGSVGATLLTILAQGGYRVGFYTSPHLSSVRERFRINNEYISKEKFAELATRIKGVLGDEKITYFEFTTSLALLWFAESNLDLVILETGMGGRLDATNVVLPLVTVITNVSMDHEAYLGNTLADVAAEKAGIIKENVPLVSGVAADESLEVVGKVCRTKAAPLYLYGKDFRAEQSTGSDWSWIGSSGALAGFSYEHLRCSMKGSYQIVNTSLALAVLVLLGEYEFRVGGDDVRLAVSHVRWPGRLEYLTLDRKPRGEEGTVDNKDAVHFLLDGAHNPAGVLSLVATLRDEYNYGKLILVWGAMADKDLSLTLPIIAGLADKIVLTRPDSERSAEPALLLDYLTDEDKKKAILIDKVDEALLRAETLAGSKDLIVIAGSLYLIGESREILAGGLVD